METWTPGNPGSPTRADSKQELLSSVPQPEPVPCPDPECDRVRYVQSQRRGRGQLRYWKWVAWPSCQRCHNLRFRHGLDLAGLLAIWEAQGRRCYRYPECQKVLEDPRVIVNGGRDARIDHDHGICPQVEHSCERCRRGLACNICNTHALSVRTTGFWVPPEGDDLVRWLEFLGPGDRDRLRQALTLFPEQPVRRVSRRQSRGEREPGEVIPLFDLGADSA